MKRLRHLAITIQPWERDMGRYRTQELKITVITDGRETHETTKIIDGDHFNSMFDYAIDEAIRELRTALGMERKR